MTAPILTSTRTTRPSAAKAAPTVSPDAAAAKLQGDDALATQSSTFDATQAESAELERELQALDTMLMAQLKDEDAILNKWIAMID